MSGAPRRFDVVGALLVALAVALWLGADSAAWALAGLLPDAGFPLLSLLVRGAALVLLAAGLFRLRASLASGGRRLLAGREGGGTVEMPTLEIPSSETPTVETPALKASQAARDRMQPATSDSTAEMAIDDLERPDEASSQVEPTPPASPPAPAAPEPARDIARRFEDLGAKLAAEIQEQVLRSLGKQRGAPSDDDSSADEIAARVASLGAEIDARVQAALARKGIRREDG